jgi:2-phosphoglycerate kinase
MSQPRRIMPLPLGGEHGLPYSRGLMARALMAVGVSPDRAYGLARRVGDDLAAPARRCGSCAATKSSASSTCRS